jgi:hypothetical protein
MQNDRFVIQNDKCFRSIQQGPGDSKNEAFKVSAIVPEASKSLWAVSPSVNLLCRHATPALLFWVATGILVHYNGRPN